MGRERSRVAVLGRLRKRMFGISLDETTFRKRGFHTNDPRTQGQLEQVGRTFLNGYHLAMQTPGASQLAGYLEEIGLEWRGFAYEGAAMALALLDSMTPFGGRRWRNLLEGPGDAHAYMVHVGFGWAAARIPWLRRRLRLHIEKFDPLLRWLIFDGYGFHQGYFHWPQFVRQQALPPKLSGYGLRAFDQGLGRSLWFVEGADISRIEKTVRAFPTERQGDLFGGLGLACTYAGGVERDAIERLRNVAGTDLGCLCQGAAFAAKARQRAGNPTPQAELACQILCGMQADAAAALTDHCLADLPADDSQPAFEHWRVRIQTRLTEQHVPIGVG